MDNVSTIGIDISKNVFHLHGASGEGAVVFRRVLSRSRVLDFLAKFDACLVALEACASAHYWGREIGKLGHEVRLIPPQYVKPFVKRQKNDAADAEAIVEAALRPSMRFVAVKSADRQGQAMVLKTRDLFTAQRTQAVNALRGHLAEYGVIAPTGLANLTKLETALGDPKHDLPEVVIALCRRFLDQIDT